MDPSVIGLIIFVVMLLMVLFGLPIFICMIATSLAGFYLISGPKMMLMQLTSGPFAMAVSYSFAVLPLFSLLGMLAGETGIAGSAYAAAKIWLGKRKGGLLYTTVVANAIFGACSGINSASNIVFAKIALPELDKYGYNRRLSLGCICGSSALAPMIPPSIPIVMYCLLSGYSIGRTLIGGFGAGIILVVVLFLTIKIECTLYPSKVPPVREEDRNVSLNDKLRSLKLLIPLALLFALIIGGTFAGWFHATVGGAIGAVAVIIYAFAKHMPAKRVLAAAWEGGHIFAGIYPIIIAGTLFSRFITLSGLPQLIVNFFASIHMPPFGVYMLVVLYFIIAGCIMDLMATIIISVPIVFPLLVDSLGYDPYVLIIALVLLSSIASITPPIGMGVFTISNVTRIPTTEIFAGIMPFLFALVVTTILIILVPQVVTFLPDMLAGIGGS